MKRLATFLSLAALAAGAASAQPVRKERDVGKQRAAVEAWTSCIADEQSDRVGTALNRDFRSKEYKSELMALSKTRVSSGCFNAMPREYRRIQLGGLPFAGGLAERMIERGERPLLMRLSKAALLPEIATYSRSDALAMCMVRGAPHLAAGLFATPISTQAEEKALAQLQPVSTVCAGGEGRLDASPLGLRSMLATASYRLLAAAGELN